MEDGSLWRCLGGVRIRSGLDRDIEDESFLVLCNCYIFVFDP